MSNQATSLTDYGYEGRWNWLISGAIGGIAGALTFGAFLGLIYPNVLSVTIPSLYGLEPGGSSGMALHLAHGLVLGVIFGFLITRETVFRTLTTTIETSFLASLGPGMQLTLAGIVYGFVIWILLPFLALPLWESIAGNTAPDFPAAAIESLVGHLLYGTTLGFIFASFISMDFGE